MGTFWANPDGLRVHFGTRQTVDEGNFNETGAVGTYKELVVYLRGSDFTANVYTGTTITIPSGFTVREVLGEVVTAFVLTGTTPTINVGISGSEATNRAAQLSEAQAEAAGVYSLTASAAGTLAVDTPHAAGGTLNIALGGTTPTVTTAGLLKITIRWQDTAAS